MGKCCDLANVAGAVVALALSILGVSTSASAQFKVMTALHGAGSGAGKLQAMAQAVDFNFSVLIIVNVISTLIICLSTFDCTHLQKHPALHIATSSTALCIWRILASITFLVQLIMSQFFMVAVVMVSTLVFLCHSGPAIQYETQELLYSLGNTTTDSGASYNPYGETTQDVDDTPLVSFKELVAHLSMEIFCKLSKGLGKAAICFWFGCFLTTISQAIMAIALNGEKERVSVHEHYEKSDEFRAMGDGHSDLADFEHYAGIVGNQSLRGLQGAAANIAPTQHFLAQGR